MGSDTRWGCIGAGNAKRMAMFALICLSSAGPLPTSDLRVQIKKSIANLHKTIEGMSSISVSANGVSGRSGQEIDVVLKEVSVGNQRNIRKIWQSFKAATGFTPTPPDVLAVAAADSNCVKLISQQANFTFVPMQASKVNAIRTKYANTTACGAQQLNFRFSRDEKLFFSTTLDSQGNYGSKLLDATVEFDLLLIEAHTEGNLICLCQFDLLCQQSGDVESD
jgi:hypothetical protein